MNEQIKQNNAQAVAEYLQSHPDFFVENEQLLRHLHIPHSCGDARSIIEYKVKQLEQKNSQLTTQLNNLVNIARSNDELHQQLHQFILAMIGKNDLPQTLDTIRSHLQNNFRANQVNIHLLVEEPQQMCVNGHYVSQSDPRLQMFSHAFAEQQPICGRLKADQLAFLFADHADDIKSTVLIPLVDTSTIGLLAIGSHDAQRFPPGMGTTFLNQMGEIISLVLSKHLV